MVPVMILGFVSAERCLVSVNVEYDGVYSLQVKLQALLKGIGKAFEADFGQVLTHFENVEILGDVAG